jgi:hypothetical protein
MDGVLWLGKKKRVLWVELICSTKILCFGQSFLENNREAKKKQTKRSYPKFPVAIKSPLGEISTSKTPVLQVKVFKQNKL